MTATRNRIDETADATARMSRRAIDFLETLDGFIKDNQAFSIDWGGATKPPNLEEGEGGEIQGRDWDRFRVSNAIGTLAAIAASADVNARGNLRIMAGPRG